MNLQVGFPNVCTGDVQKDQTTMDMYKAAFRLPNVTPQTIEWSEDPSFISQAVARMGLIVLCGGVDIDPARYGAAPSPRLGPVNRARDAFEVAVLDAAMAQKKPVFGICRGVQMINVYFGGTLWQDLPSEFPVKGLAHRCSGTPHDPVQTLDLMPKSFLADAFGVTRLGVNSLHHQAVQKLAPGFQVAAYAQDGVVEAIEDPVRHVRGVQFHPERLICKDEKWKKLFQKICDDARAVRI